MSRHLTVGMLGLGLAALALTGSDGLAQQKKPAGWQNSYATARQEARQTGKPIFLLFR